MCLCAMRKTQKIGKWIPHELNDWHYSTCEILLAKLKRKLFLHGNEMCIYFQNLKSKKSWVDPTNNQIALYRKQYNVFGISRVLFNMSCWNLVKLPMSTTTTNNWFNLLCFAWKKAWISTKTWQADFPPWQCFIVHSEYYLKLPLTTTTCFRQWATRSLNNTDCYEDVRKWLEEWFTS